MKKYISIALVTGLVLTMSVSVFAQNFTVPAKGVQNFNIEDKNGRNQAVFYSSTPLEDITGTTSGIAGMVSFDPTNVAGTVKADIRIDVASMKTGINMRDDHLRSEMWLDAKSHPSITFRLKKLVDVKNNSTTSISATAVGDFTLKGKTVEVRMPVTMTYFVESEKTKMRAPGDLLAIKGKGKLQLSKFGVQNKIVGMKVSEEITFEVNAIASNASDSM